MGVVATIIMSQCHNCIHDCSNELLRGHLRAGPVLLAQVGRDPTAVARIQEFLYMPNVVVDVGRWPSG